MRWIIIFVIGVLSLPAWGEEVLYCTDKGAVGFVWADVNGKPRPATYAKTQWVVKVISSKRRDISVGDNTYTYACLPPEDGRISCHQRSFMTWIFMGDQYLRTSMIGANILTATEIRELSAARQKATVVIAHGACAK